MFNLDIFKCCVATVTVLEPDIAFDQLLFVVKLLSVFLAENL